MNTYSLVSTLPIEIDSYELEGLSVQVSPEFTRRTTVIHLHGGGETGIGEDPTYSPEDHEAFQAEGPTLPLPGSHHTVDSFSELLERLSLWPAGPALDQFRPYRRWAFESAALDRALPRLARSLPRSAREARPDRNLGRCSGQRARRDRRGRHARLQGRIRGDAGRPAAGSDPLRAHRARVSGGLARGSR